MLSNYYLDRTSPMLLGDAVHDALALVGVTPERVSRWLGKNCQCDERLLKLNAVDIWARRTLRGKLADAKQYLVSMLEDD